MNINNKIRIQENIEVKSYHRNEIFFFDELVSLIAALSSFDIAIEVHEKGGISLNSMKVDHCVYLHGRLSTYSWNPYHTLASLKNDVWPNTLILAKLPACPSTNIESTIELKDRGISSFIHSTCGLTFMLYYERIKPLVSEKYGKSTDNWPTLLNFCRIVRNSIAHGGKINIQNKNATSVEWNGIKICPTDNGESIFQPQKYIGVGDLILLIEESEHFIV